MSASHDAPRAADTLSIRYAMTHECVSPEASLHQNRIGRAMRSNIAHFGAGLLPRQQQRVR